MLFERRRTKQSRLARNQNIDFAAAVRARRCPHSRKKGERVARKPLQQATRRVAPVTGDRATIKHEGERKKVEVTGESTKSGPTRAKRATTTAKLESKELKKVRKVTIRSLPWSGIWSTRACVTNATENEKTPTKTWCWRSSQAGRAVNLRQPAW